MLLERPARLGISVTTSYRPFASSRPNCCMSVPISGHLMYVLRLHANSILRCRESFSVRRSNRIKATIAPQLHPDIPLMLSHHISGPSSPFVVLRRSSMHLFIARKIVPTFPLQKWRCTSISEDSCETPGLNFVLLFKERSAR